MSKLQVKAVSRNKVVRRNLKGFGTLMIDTSKIETQEDMQKWKRRGLDIFEVVTEQNEAPTEKKSKGKVKKAEATAEEEEEEIEEVEEEETEEAEATEEEKPKKARQPRKKATE